MCSATATPTTRASLHEGHPRLHRLGLRRLTDVTDGFAPTVTTDGTWLRTPVSTQQRRATMRRDSRGWRRAIMRWPHPLRGRSVRSVERKRPDRSRFGPKREACSHAVVALACSLHQWSLKQASWESAFLTSRSAT